MDVQQYFAANQLKPRDEYDFHRQLRVIDYRHGWAYIGSERFKEDGDALTIDELFDAQYPDCNARLFDAMALEAMDFSDVVEPFCRSGLFGCYLASSMDGVYHGIDPLDEAVEKAYERKNRLSSSLYSKASKKCILPVLDAPLDLNNATFEVSDVGNYGKTHEAIVGRYLLSKKWRINEGIIPVLMKISTDMVLCEADVEEKGFTNYVEMFARQGLNARLIEFVRVPFLRGPYSFVMRVSRN